MFLCLQDSQCEKLWCKKVGAKTCSSQGDKMADGTSCGPEKVKNQ